MRKVPRTVVFGAVLAGGLNGNAYAGPPTEGANGLEEVIVTAQKRQENLQSVPIAVSALTADDLSASGVIDTTSLSSLVPGLSVGVTTQNFEPRLRGVGTASNGPGIENPVALYVDGVYYASQLMGLGDLSGVSQVTVIKGPQGTLFGRNATGGVIQMTTRDPSDSFGGEVQLELDNYETSRNFAYLTGSVASNLATNLFVRYATQGEGWGKNRFNGDEVHRIDRDVALRNKWLFTPSESTTIKLNLDYQDAANSLGPNLRPGLGTTPLIGGYTGFQDPYDVDTYLTNRNEFKQRGASLTLNENFDFAQLVSITAYRDYDFYTQAVPSATPLPGLDFFFVQEGKQLTQELQLVSKQNDAFNWVLGAYYFSGHEILDPFTIFLYGPLAHSAIPTDVFQIDINDGQRTRSLAGFAQSTARIFADTNLTLGLRYTHEKREFDGTELGFFNGFELGPISSLPPRTEITAKKPTWRVSIDHQFSDDVLTYVSYNRGFKSGGFNGFEVSNPPYEPEILDAYELGVKSEWLDSRVRVNAAAFFYDYTQIQVTRYTNTAIVYNGAKAELYGVDLDVEAKVNRNLKLSGGVEWIHSEFLDFDNAQHSTSLPDGGVQGFQASAAGNRLPFTPKVMLTASVDYSIDLAAGALRFNITNSYNSGFFTEADNNLRQPSFDYLNVGIGWEPGNSGLSLKLWGKNLFDEHVVGQLQTGVPQGISADYSNPPLTYGFTIGYTFGSGRR